MERKVGEIFEYNEEWYQCIVQPKGTEGQSCSICSMNFGGKCPIHVIECAMEGRSDGKSVIFKKLEKVGEPMKIHDRLVLKVKTDAYKCMRCCFYSKGTCELTMEECAYYDCGEEIKFVEIKQNKENMEEKKLNLKEFNLEAAKAGKPVCTRDGRKARIISFDRHGEDCPIIALVVDSKNAECEEVIDYTLDGICNENIINHNKYDLMMFTRKKEGWLNIFKDFEDTVCCVYPTEKEALEDGEIEKDYITTIKIEWEE